MFREFGFRADYDEQNRTIKQEDVTYKDKKYLISTVDLGLDHSFGEGPPLYWETMIFPEGEWGDLYCERYSSIEDAKKGHEKAKELLMSGEIVK